MKVHSGDTINVFILVLFWVYYSPASWKALLNSVESRGEDIKMGVYWSSPHKKCFWVENKIQIWVLFQQRTIKNEKFLSFRPKENSENFTTMIWGYFNEGPAELFLFTRGVQGALPKTWNAHGRQKQGTQQMQRQRAKHFPLITIIKRNCLWLLKSVGFDHWNLKKTEH